MIQIGPLREDDPAAFEAAFAGIGWTKPAAQYVRYLDEQTEGARSVLVARREGEFLGYLTVLWASDYPTFRDGGIPEIQDFNVLPHARRQGIGSALMDAAEALIGEHATLAGIGVGLYPDYGPAQRLYVLRGYIPDGRGVAWNLAQVVAGQQVPVDDDLALYFTKAL